MTLRISISDDALAVACGANRVADALASAAPEAEIVRVSSWGMHWLEPLALNRDPFAQGLKVGVGWPTVNPNAVPPHPACRGQFKFAFDPAIIGEQQKTFGIDIEPSNGHHARHVIGHGVIDRAPPLFVGIRRHETNGLVI